MTREGSATINDARPHACGAKTRAGRPCKNAQMPNGRCRMHGGKSKGPRTPEGIEAIRKAITKHGMRSKSFKTLMGELRYIKRTTRDLLTKLKQVACENPDAIRSGGLDPERVLKMRDLS